MLTFEEMKNKQKQTTPIHCVHWGDYKILEIEIKQKSKIPRFTKHNLSTGGAPSAVLIYHSDILNYIMANPHGIIGICSPMKNDEDKK